MRTVLLIDDDVPGLKTRAMLLRAVGYNVLTAETGGAGIELAPQADVVVLDYSLPDMRCEEVLCQLRNTHPTLPVILLSGMLAVTDEAKRMAFAVIVKGEGAQRLLDVLDGG